MTYEPDTEAARLAPACVCNVASRVVWLRDKIKMGEFDRETARKLAPFIAPLPFEAELMSGNMERVDAAVKAIGETALNSHILTHQDFDAMEKVKWLKDEATAERQLNAIFLTPSPAAGSPGASGAGSVFAARTVSAVS